jgi:3-oxoacyl-[acyl-carrier protein] reductase
VTNNRLNGKTAIVTGAGQGIGEAIAMLFASQGAEVVLSARSVHKLKKVSEKIAINNGISYEIPADVGSTESVEGLVKSTLDRFQKIDILVHNAGIFPYDPLENMSDEAWQEVINVNLTGGFRLIRACLPSMKQTGSGRILFTSSVQGNRTAVPGCAHYAASKAGINGLIRSAAFELAQHKITVNGVEPGLVLTQGVESALSDRRRENMAQYVPLGRWGRPDEVAQAMLYLASDEAAYVTGQTIVVDGGALLPQNGSFMA